MAVDLTALFTIIGKYVKSINSVYADITTLNTLKGEIFAELEAENLEDLYVTLPAQITTMQSSITSWIQTFISNVEDLLTNEEYILENLPISETSVTAVLNAIFDQMITDSETIKSSVVSLGGSDVDQTTFQVAGADTFDIFVTRLLDGTSDPSDLVTAHSSYNMVEGQLAKSATIYAKCLSEEVGSQSFQLFANSPDEASYTADTESPGTGPTIVDAYSENLISTNYDFTEWSGDNPTNWTLAGGSAGTAWEDESGTGDGPLQINTVGVTLKRQIPNLTRRKMYFFAASARFNGSTPTTTIKLRVESIDGASVYKNFTNVTLGDTADTKTIYGFWAPGDDTNLNDVYFCFEHDAETDSGSSTLVGTCVVAPVTYFNGLGWAAFNGAWYWRYDGNAEEYTPSVVTDDYGSIAVSNNNAGVFQTYFRKAHNIQLPTADSPTIADSLAT